MPDQTPKQFDYDPPQATPPLPDREAVRLAHADMLASEIPQQRYIRQQWEVALASVKVAMDAWRRIYPERLADDIPESLHERVGIIADNLEQTYLDLDLLTQEMQGTTMRYAQAGRYSADDVRSIVD